MARDPVTLATAVGLGIATGFLGAALFLVIHMFLIQPIFGAWPRGIGVAVVGGAAMGVLYRAARRHVPGGLAFGALVALTVVPFLFAGEARTRGLDPVPATALLAVMLAAVGAVAWGVVARTATPFQAIARLGVGAAGVAVLNLYPAIFLFNLSVIIDDRRPNPWPMASALMFIYIVCGAVLGAWMSARERDADEWDATRRRLAGRRRSA